ncbi:MAG: hypothetical protein AB8B53_04290 [Flavobacteriales bacterium]
MKKVMYFCLAALLPTIGFSQDSNYQEKEKRWLSGFNFSVTQSNLIYDNEVSAPPIITSPNLTNSLGFGLGITTEYKATKHLGARVSAGLAFNGGYFTYTATENDEELFERDQHFLPVTLDAGMHGILTLKDNGASPYSVIGITARLPIDVSDDTREIPAQNGFISADFGIGFHKPLTHFNLRPELRYSYAVQGLNHVRLAQKTYMHQISLIIGLNG